MPKNPGGDDPTRREPGGSRMETIITEASELGSDNAAGDDRPPLSSPGANREGSPPDGKGT